MCSVHRPKSQDIELSWRRCGRYGPDRVGCVLGKERYGFLRLDVSPGLGFKLGSMVIGSILLVITPILIKNGVYWGYKVITHPNH